MLKYFLTSITLLSLLSCGNSTSVEETESDKVIEVNKGSYTSTINGIEYIIQLHDNNENIKEVLIEVEVVINKNNRFSLSSLTQTELIQEQKNKFTIQKSEVIKGKEFTFNIVEIISGVNNKGEVLNQGYDLNYDGYVESFKLSFLDEGKLHFECDNLHKVLNQIEGGQSYTSKNDQVNLAIDQHNNGTSQINEEGFIEPEQVFDYSDIEFIDGIPNNLIITAELISDDNVVNDKTQYYKREIKIDFRKNLVVFSTSQSSEGYYPKFHSKKLETVNIINKTSSKVGVVTLSVKDTETNTYFIGKEIIIDFNTRVIKWLNQQSTKATYTWNDFDYIENNDEVEEISELLIYNGYRAGSEGLQQDKVILTSDLYIKHYILDWDKNFLNAQERIEAEYFPINYEVKKVNDKVSGILVKCAKTKNEAANNKAIYVFEFSVEKSSIIYWDPTYNYTVGEISNVHLGTYPSNENFEGKGYTLNRLGEIPIQFSK